MSNLDFFGTPAGSPVLATPPTPTTAPVRRRTALLIAGLLAVVAALVIGVVVLRPHPRDGRPVVLPDRLAGLLAAEATLQFADHVDWRTHLSETLGNQPFDGRAFGVRPGPIVNLVVVRADSRGEADPALGRPPYLNIGDVSCTHTFQLAHGVERDQDRWCWRVRRTTSRRRHARSTRSGLSSTDIAWSGGLADSCTCGWGTTVVGVVPHLC